MKTQEIDFEDMVKTLAKSGDVIAAEITGDDAHNLHMAVGISGEAGELLDAVKKAVIYRKPLNLKNVVEELGDLEFYMEGLRQKLGITREETLTANKEKLGERYKGFKYSDGAAQTREDKKRKLDLSAPYLDNGKWFVDEQLYPETRGFIAHEFSDESQAQEFINSAE